MSRRTIALVIAIVLAAVAAIALLSYVQGVDERALEGQQPVTVFRAKDIIPAGLSAESAQQQGLIEQVSIPSAIRPLTAITSLSEIAGQVASVEIPPQEVLLTNRWVAPGQQLGNVLNIPNNRVAMTMEVGIPPGVAGFIRTGDHISVVARIQITEVRATQAELSATGSRVQFVVQDIQVLSVGRRVITVTQEGTSGESTETPQDRVLVTVAVTPGQAERLVFSILEGEVYFTLLPDGADPVDTNGRTARNVFP